MNSDSLVVVVVGCSYHYGFCVGIILQPIDM